MNRLFLFSILFMPYWALAQNITSGPVVGGVTANTARIYIQTNVPTEFDIEMDTLSNFGTSFIITDSTQADQFNMTLTDVAGLLPFKKYYYRYLIGGQAQDSVYQFTSFPEEDTAGHYKIAVGSCNYFQNYPLFGHIKAFDPMLFVHLGDWKYPPSTFGWNYNLLPDRIAQSFAYRYNGPNMARFILPNTAIDYIYDDSYCHNSNQGATYPRVQQVQLAPDSIFYDLQTIEFDEGVIPGAINGYFEHFPGYEAVDTAIGIHHSFKLGNVEFFMLDLRNSASPQHDAFVYHPETNMYTFEPGPDHSMMTEGQRNWLLQGLQNSTADWKVIGSGLMFNKRFEMFMTAAMQLQAIERSIIEYASDLAYFWHAYPADQNTLLDFIEQNEIKDVIVISGDSHSSMVDDGTNAGLPELSASGLSSEDQGYLNHSLDSIMDLLGLGYGTIDSLWNGGGNGVDNENFADSYGTMEFNGKEAVRLCAMDELGQEMGCILVYHSTNPVGTGSVVEPSKERFFVAFPNPTKDRLRVDFKNGYFPSNAAKMQLHSMEGKLIQAWFGSQIQNRMTVAINELSSGSYTLTFVDGGVTDTRIIVVSP